jgi:uncharacterized protein (TIGR03435 family)
MGINTLHDVRVMLFGVPIAMRQLHYPALLISAICAGSAQEADTSLKFEVASVKVSVPPTVDPHILAMRTPPDPPGRFTQRDLPLSTLIIRAYRLRSYEYAGPSWLTSARFDIVAKVPEGATQAQQMVMLQNLLAERFGLKVHREKREMPVYELAIAKGGPKFKEAVPVAPPAAGSYDADGVPVLPPGGGAVWGLRGKDGTSTWAVMHEEITMQRLATILSSSIGGRPVTDATGLTGKFDLAMHWLMYTDPPDSTAPDDPSIGGGPAVFAALQSQLGLKLESKKGLVEVLVVDHCERTPTEN